MKKHVNSGNGEEMFTCDVIVCVYCCIIVYKLNMAMLSTNMHTCANKQMHECMYAPTHMNTCMHTCSYIDLLIMFMYRFDSQCYSQPTSGDNPISSIRPEQTGSSDLKKRQPSDYFSVLGTFLCLYI